MDDITFVRSHWWLVSEGFSLSTANSDVQKLPATLYHRIADSPRLCRLKCVKSSLVPDKAQYEVAFIRLVSDDHPGLGTGQQGYGLGDIRPLSAGVKGDGMLGYWGGGIVYHTRDD